MIFFRKMLSIYEKHPSFACIYTKSLRVNTRKILIFFSTKMSSIGFRTNPLIHLWKILCQVFTCLFTTSLISFIGQPFSINDSIFRVTKVKKKWNLKSTGKDAKKSKVQTFFDAKKNLTHGKFSVLKLLDLENNK